MPKRTSAEGVLIVAAGLVQAVEQVGLHVAVPQVVQQRGDDGAADLGFLVGPARDDSKAFSSSPTPPLL